ncbi:MAG: glutathione S-transferase family protein [Pseudomonadota bacterium]
MLTIYGVPNSQPVRTVLWACMLHQLPFELRLTSQNRDAKQAEYLDTVNPRGTIPAIDDDGFRLWESHAIVIYLAEKYGWTDYWPDDLKQRAWVNQYLHFHHRNTREVVVAWSRALWPQVFGVSDPSSEWIRQNTFAGLENNEVVVEQTLAIIDRWLHGQPYLVGETPTLADLSAYQELGQNQRRYADCTDFSPYCAIRAWLERMGALPYHDDVHAIWGLIGKASEVERGMSTIAAANKAAARQIQEAVAKYTATEPTG